MTTVTKSVRNVTYVDVYSAFRMPNALVKRFIGKMNLRPVAERIVQTFQKTLCLGVEDTKPSSFWNEQMVMLNDEELPFDLRLYGSWHEYKERFVNGWILYSPYHVFRLQNDDYMVLGHRKKEWLVYDIGNKTIKKTLAGSTTLETYSSFVKAIQAIGEECAVSSV